jgi:hypothetical protein
VDVDDAGGGVGGGVCCEPCCALCARQGTAILRRSTAARVIAAAGKRNCTCR